MLSTTARRAVRAWTVLVLVFLYAPLLLVVINAFNVSKSFAFPPTGFTLQWFVDAANSEGMWTSLANSAVVGVGATVIALVLGTMAAFAVKTRSGRSGLGLTYAGMAPSAINKFLK